MTTIAYAVTDGSPATPTGRHPDRATAGSGDPSRLRLDWTRGEPEEGRYDESVFDDYAVTCEAERARGAEPVIVLHHNRLPGWLGRDFWLRLEAPTRFGTWAAAVADRLGGLSGHVVTLAEPNDVALRAWITGALPPYRVGAVGDLVRALDHALAAHVVAQAAVHRVRADAVVTMETRSLPVYELDGLLLDVLAAPAHGVARYDLHPWLVERRRDWYRRRRPPSVTGAFLRRVARSTVPLDQALPRAVAAVYDGARGRPFDAGLRAENKAR